MLYGWRIKKTNLLCYLPDDVSKLIYFYPFSFRVLNNIIHYDTYRILEWSNI